MQPTDNSWALMTGRAKTRSYSVVQRLAQAVLMTSLYPAPQLVSTGPCWLSIIGWSTAHAQCDLLQDEKKDDHVVLHLFDDIPVVHGSSFIRVMNSFPP